MAKNPWSSDFYGRSSYVRRRILTPSGQMVIVVFLAVGSRTFRVLWGLRRQTKPRIAPPILIKVVATNRSNIEHLGYFLTYLLVVQRRDQLHHTIFVSYLLAASEYCFGVDKHQEESLERFSVCSCVNQCLLFENNYQCNNIILYSCKLRV